jgi:class 3 adenylate cyclase/tRNA A-37 threonylcarbamoyl transferase component Bud32
MSQEMPVESFQPADTQFPATEAAPLEPLRQSPEAPPRIVARAEPEGQLATFMYARVRNFTATCHTMAGEELTAFVNEVRRILQRATMDLEGEIAQRKPDSILCVFSHRPEDSVPVHAKRALHAAILTVHAVAVLADRIAARPQSAGLPPLSIAIGVHLGAAEVTPRPSNPGMVHAVGEAVEIARLLEVVAADLHWSIAASFSTRQAAGSRVDSARSGTLGLPDETFLEVVEIAGLVPRLGSTTPESHYAMLRESLRKNQQLSRASAASRASGHMLIEGYRLLRKIGEGGVATVYLAQPMAGGAAQVLKVLRLDDSAVDMDLQRFITEFALVAQIDHPNVAHIFKQDFSAGCAYIAMEYFPLGDLRSHLKKALDPGIALYYVSQIAAGLEAIHQVGIVHRDLKPHNVMLRQDGILAITDFGIAKQVSMTLTDTGAGEIIGTPYYLSPEQALGHPVDARTDIYSLGVMTYEMLTGHRPYHAPSAQELLDMHIQAPVPTLPAPLQRLQPVLDKMMAKDPQQRYASAAQLLDALTELGA